MTPSSGASKAEFYDALQGLQVSKVTYNKYYTHLAYVLAHVMRFVIILDIWGLLDVRANLFLAVLSSSFSVFIILGIDNFAGELPFGFFFSWPS